MQDRDGRPGRGARRRVAAVHRWLSLVVGLWVVGQGLSGAVLAVEDLVNAWARPGLYHHGQGNAGAAAASAAAHGALPAAHLATLNLPAVYRGVYVADMVLPTAQHRLVFVDPASSHVNGIRNPAEGFTHWVERWHGSLLQTGRPLGLVNANQLVGLFGVLTLVTVLIGLWLWYRPKVKAFHRLRRFRSAMAWSRDLHRSVGALAVPFLVLVMTTGLTLKFGAEMRPAWYRLTGARDQGHKTLTAPPQSHPVLGSNPLGVGEIVDAVRSIGGTPLTVTPASKATAPAIVVLSHGLDPAAGRAGQGGNRVAYVDAYSGAVLQVVSAGDKGAAAQAYEYWAFPLHGGTFAGPVSRVVWVFIGLSPLVLAVSGAASAALRRNRRKRPLRPRLPASAREGIASEAGRKEHVPAVVS